MFFGLIDGADSQQLMIEDGLLYGYALEGGNATLIRYTLELMWKLEIDTGRWDAHALKSYAEHNNMEKVTSLLLQGVSIEQEDVPHLTEALITINCI